MGRQALAAAGIALLVAGCGGGQRPRPALSPKAFLAAADRICAQATTRGGRLARLRALRPQASAAELYGHWLKAEEDAFSASASLADPKKKTEVDPAVELAIAEGKIAGYARRLGAETCAKHTIGTMPP